MWTNLWTWHGLIRRIVPDCQLVANLLKCFINVNDPIGNTSSIRVRFPASYVSLLSVYPIHFSSDFWRLFWRKNPTTSNFQGTKTQFANGWFSRSIDSSRSQQNKIPKEEYNEHGHKSVVSKWPEKTHLTCLFKIFGHNSQDLKNHLNI